MTTDTIRPLGRVWLLVLVCLLTQGGCTFFTFPIRGIEASCLPAGARGMAKRDLTPIAITQLTQQPPDVYRLAPGDIIGVYVPGVIPFQSPMGEPQLPPIHFPQPGSDLQPSVGLPVVVQASGKITLSAVRPIDVTGLSLEQAAEFIRQTYLANDVLRDQDVIPVVNLIRPRTYNVTVIREDTGSGASGGDHSAFGAAISLPAYKNDVLNALMATGGLPGLAAKNEIRIYKKKDPKPEVIPPPREGDILPAAFQDYRPIDSQCLHAGMVDMDSPDVIIPLRVPVGTQLEIDPQSILLDDGDVILIANRTTEVYYTSGLLPAGEHLLPRDYDLDIFAAMARAGYSYGGAGQGGGGGGGMGGGMMPPTGIMPSQLFIFRQRPDGTQYAIEVNLPRAVADERERLLIQPGDRLLLRFSPKEEIMNFGMFAFFAFGIREFFRN